LLSSLTLRDRSRVEIGRATIALSQDYRLVAWGEDLQQIEGERTSSDGNDIVIGAASHSNLQFLRASLPWLTPKLIGTHLSVGFGDRIGLATAGHIRAMRIAGQGVSPVFAQQSIREMSRTGRSPSQVIDDAAWGVFAEGWREGFGADADHVKSESDIDACVAAGFTFYTIDPSEHVWSDADVAKSGDVEAVVRSLPWRALEDSEPNLLQRHWMPIEATMRAAAKYGRALAHVVRIDRYARSRLGTGFELEVSVDETDTPTTPEQHEYLAVELRRLGVRFISLAPRFVGSFEKGVDYIGNVTDFEAQFAQHAEIAQRVGPYKLGLHSGSDKFSIYETAARLSGGFLHLKTSGTSWLEALRVVGTWDPDLLADIYALALDGYAEERASYHVSADSGDAPAVANLDASRVRQILHVTFSAVMRRYGPQLLQVLRAHRDDYEAEIESTLCAISPLSARELNDASGSNNDLHDSVASVQHLECSACVREVKSMRQENLLVDGVISHQAQDGRKGADAVAAGIDLCLLSHEGDGVEGWRLLVPTDKDDPPTYAHDFGCL